MIGLVPQALAGLGSPMDPCDGPRFLLLSLRDGLGASGPGHAWIPIVIS